mgnify:CR=1 FL=1
MPYFDKKRIRCQAGQPWNEIEQKHTLRDCKQNGTWIKDNDLEVYMKGMTKRKRK